VPRLADRRNWTSWAQDGGSDVAERAGKRAERLLASSKPAQGLPKARAQAVDEFVGSILKRHGVVAESVLQ
jgi:trimethylamine:corrinoid methyltransferase-like protein